MKKSTRLKKAIKKTKPVIKKSKVSSIKRRRNINFGVSKERLKVAIERNISVVKASYLHDNTLLVTFSNGREKKVDFSSFFNSNNIPYLKKYKSERLFKKFKIEDGNVVWGKDWDLIFPVSQLYTNKIQ